MTRHIILDWAFNVLSPEKLLLLKNSGGVEGCIIRTCEGWGIDDNIHGDIDRQVENLSLAEMPFCVYQYAHAGLNAARQVSFFYSHSLQYNPGALIGDYEAYINYWVNPVRAYYPVELADGFERHSALLAAGTTLPTVNYSGPWVSQWSNLLPLVWACRWFWGAEYRYDWDKDRPSLWPRSWAEWQYRIKNLAFPYNPLYPTWALWQFAGNIVPPGVGHHVDVSICDNDALFNALFNGGPVPALPDAVVTAEYRVSNLLGTYLQPFPRWNEHGRYLAFNAKLEVCEDASIEGWLKVINPAGWVDRRRVKKV